MKIGTSLGKCVKDILDGHVRYEDVLCVVSNTNCPELEQLMGVIEQYYYEYKGVTSGRGSSYNMSAHSLADACAVAQRLMEDGKLHQPRAVGRAMWGNAHALQDTWYDIMPSPTSDSESVREAWDHYTMLKKLAA